MNLKTQTKSVICHRALPSGSSTVRISEKTEKSSFFIWNATYMSSGSTATKSASRLFTFSKHSMRSLAATQRIVAYSDGVLSTNSVHARYIKSGTHILSNRRMPTDKISLTHIRYSMKSNKIVATHILASHQHDKGRLKRPALSLCKTSFSQIEFSLRLLQVKRKFILNSVLVVRCLITFFPIVQFQF